MPSEPTTWRNLISGRNAAYSLILFGATILHAVNVYLTITILPSVVRDIGGLDYYAWNTTLFVVASILGRHWQRSSCIWRDRKAPIWWLLSSSLWAH